MSFIGFKNYLGVLQDHRFFSSLRVAFIYMGAAVSLEVLVGLGLALLLNATLLNGKRVFQTLILLPLMVAPTIVAIIWRWLLSDVYGLVNYFLTYLGFRPPLWLASPFWALFSIIFVDVWLTAPFAMIVFLAALQSLPAEQYEAAAIDGASFGKIFWFIILPWLKTPTLVIVTLRSMDIFRMFDFIYVLTQGGPARATETLIYYVYRVGFQFWRISQACALAIFVLVIIFLLTVVYIRALRYQ